MSTDTGFYVALVIASSKLFEVLGNFLSAWMYEAIGQIHCINLSMFLLGLSSILLALATHYKSFVLFCLLNGVLCMISQSTYLFYQCHYLWNGEKAQKVQTMLTEMMSSMAYLLSI